MKLINPSERLRAAVAVLRSGYTQTCRTSNCNHASHDPGYDWIEAKIDGVEIYTYPQDGHSHGCTCLMQEYVESHTAKGIPANAPKWAYTLDTRHEDSWRYVSGKGVEVSKDGDFTVVRLLGADTNRWKQIELFATKDGVNDHTKLYRKICFEKMKKDTLARYCAGGLTGEEAERLFQIGKEQWTHEQAGILMRLAPQLRQSRHSLVELAAAHSCRRQQGIIRQFGLVEIPEMSHPRTQSFADKALFVFHGKKPQPAEQAPTITTLQSRQPGLVSLSALFSAV